MKMIENVKIQDLTPLHEVVLTRYQVIDNCQVKEYYNFWN